MVLFKNKKQNQQKTIDRDRKMLYNIFPEALALVGNLKREYNHSY